MPSPFPGMDPFLEDPAVFPDLHDTLITYLREAINAVLPPPYYARGSARVWIEPVRRHVEPDVDVLRRPPAGNGNAGTGTGAISAGGVAVATESVIVRVQQEEIREPFLEVIRAGPGDDRLVATLEVLSLVNKTTGVQGRELYQRKQAQLLNSSVHLVEIDLLRGGTHSTAVPLADARAQAGPFDYHVCVREFDRPSGEFRVYPIRLENRLPTVAIPLLPGDEAVRVALQSVLDRCYDSGHYARWVRYRERTPVPPLRPEQAAWAEQVLREKGILPPPPP
jgi:hypothetical protein